MTLSVSEKLIILIMAVIIIFYAGVYEVSFRTLPYCVLIRNKRTCQLLSSVADDSNPRRIDKLL